MTQTASRTVAPPAVGIARSPARRRQLALAALSLLAAIGCGLAFALLYQNAGERQAVLAVARQVPAGEVISAADLVVVRVSLDPTLRSVAARDRRDVIGVRTPVTLLAGTLLTPELLNPRAPVDRGSAVVAVDVAQGDIPSGLRIGDRIGVVLTPPTGSPEADTATGRVIATGVVFAVDEGDDTTGSVRVSLMLPEQSAVDVATAAALDRVRLVWRGAP